MSLELGALLCVVVLFMGFLAIVGNVLERKVRAQGLDRWIPTYFAESSRRARLNDRNDQPLDVFIAVCDHFEPENGGADPETGIARVRRWVTDYPEQFAHVRDVSGRPPQHTFFFPQDEYRPQYLDELSALVTAGYGDVDIHLHHHNDTAEGFREKLEAFRNILYHRHRLLRVDPKTGKVVYGFIHGNWALCNSRRDGHWCGVDHEIPILLDTGCYADFTYPSAPSDTQPAKINRIYYAFDRPGMARSHEVGPDARVGTPAPDQALLMMQGPLVLDWSRRKWGCVPRIENGDLLASHPPRISRLEQWLSAGVTVAGQPDWRFIKLHTHGCKPGNLEMWLEGGVQQFHRGLRERHERQPNFRYHYVTAWEMAQLVHSAEQGLFQLPWQQPLNSWSSMPSPQPVLV